MNGYIYPLFEHEHILRGQMLSAMRGAAFDYAALMCEGLSEGILSGCQVLAEQDQLVVQPGLVYHEGHIYGVREPIAVPYEPTEVDHMLRMRFHGAMQKDGCLCQAVDVVNEAGLELGPQEMELCRFKLKAGSRLRSKYSDLEDYNTEFDTVNIISVPYAAREKSTLSMEILKAFAREAMAYEMEVLDQDFVLRVLGDRLPLGREAIVAYLAMRLHRPFEEYSNLDIFDMLCRVLEDIRSGSERSILTARARAKSILMD